MIRREGRKSKERQWQEKMEGREERGEETRKIFKIQITISHYIKNKYELNRNCTVEKKCLHKKNVKKVG